VVIGVELKGPKHGNVDLEMSGENHGHVMSGKSYDYVKRGKADGAGIIAMSARGGK
jgi:hypothetical protein